MNMGQQSIASFFSDNLKLDRLIILLKFLASKAEAA